VVDEHAVPAFGGGGLGIQGLLEQVDALEELHDDALGAQVGAPHLLDELGVVLALDEDAAGARGARTLIGGGERARRGARTARGRDRRRGQHHRLAVDEKAPAEREHAASAVTVLELDVHAVDPRHRPAVPVACDLDHQTGGCHDPSGLLASDIAPAARQHVRAVAIVHRVPPNA